MGPRALIVSGIPLFGRVKSFYLTVTVVPGQVPGYRTSPLNTQAAYYARVLWVKRAVKFNFIYIKPSDRAIRLSSIPTDLHSTLPSI